MLNDKNKPVIMFPLRLEILDHMVDKIIFLPPLKPGEVITKPGIITGGTIIDKPRRIVVPEQEILIRWYPDKSQLFPPVGNIEDRDWQLAGKYVKTVQNQEDKEIQKKLADELVEKVGIDRARYLVDCCLNGTNPINDQRDAMEHFLDKGAALKILPSNVEIFTVHYKGDYSQVTKTVADPKTGQDTIITYTQFEQIHTIVKPLVQGVTIPKDISFSANPEGTSKWVTDFEEAIKNGMGVRITDKAKCQQIADARWIVAVGFEDQLKTSDIIEELFIRYKALGQFDILTPGTPTNNTSSVKTGYTKISEGTLEIQEKPKLLQDSQNILSETFKISEHVFSGVRNADNVEQKQAFAFNRLLWMIATKSYFRYAMNYTTANNSTFNPNDKYPYLWETLADHFANYVAARGIAPAVRIADNPYGILPVTKLNEWESGLKDERDFVLDKVKKLCEILKQKFLGFVLPELAGQPLIEDTKFDQLLKTLQLNAVPDRLDVQFITHSGLINGDPRKIVCPLAFRDDIKTAIKFYESIVEWDYAKGNNIAIDKLRILLKKQNSETTVLRILLFYRAIELDSQIQDALYSQTLSKEEIETKVRQAKEDSAEIIKAMKYLNEFNLEAEKLEVLLKDFLDCLSCRLDAWISSLANTRLFSIDFREEVFARNTQLDSGSKESILGVYGWLEKPLNKKQNKIPEEFFQAPSLNQASAGVVLRNAALYNKSSRAGTFMTNLSSARVKKAVWFTEGLQKGYSNAELLGYQAERQIHAAGLDKYLPDLREKFCLEAQDENGSKRMVRIINGESLSKTSLSQLESDLAKLGMTSDEITSVKSIQKELNVIKDACSDLYTAEAVYQIVNGNSERAAAWMEALEGKVIPPQPEVIKTARTGHSQAQKFFWPMSAKNALDGNDPGKFSPRYIAEPVIAGFLENYFNSYDAVKFMVDIISLVEPKKSLKQSLVFTLKDQLGIDAIDLVIGGQAELDQRLRFKAAMQILSDQGNKTTIWGFIGDDFYNYPSINNLEKYAAVNIRHEYVNPGNTFYFTDVVSKAEKLNLFINSVKPLMPEDINMCSNFEEQIQLKIEIIQRLLKYRIEPLFSEFKDLAAQLRNIYENLNNASVNIYSDIQEILFRLLRFGIKEADVLIPGIANKACFKSTVKILENVLKAVEKKEKPILSENLKTLVLNISGKDIIVGLSEGQFMQQAENDPSNWSPINDDGLKLAAANKFISYYIELIKNMTSPAQPVFPAYELTAMLRIDSQTPEYTVRTLEKAISEYAKVRKNIKALSASFKDRNYFVYSKFGVKKSLMEAKLQALINASYVSEEDITDFVLLAKLLNDAQLVSKTPARRIWDMLDSTSKDLAVNISKGIINSEYDKKYLMARLNYIIKKRNMYMADFFPNTTLNAEVTTALDKGTAVLSPIELIRLNRYLLEFALPGAIKPQKGYDQLVKILESLNIPEQCFTDCHYVLPRNGINLPKGEIIVGFRIDEWADLLPSKMETTAAAFNFNTPKSQAPQAILVAVTPKIETGAVWSNQNIAEILADTIELMQIRAVPNEKVISSVLGYMFPAQLFNNPDAGKPLFPAEPLPLEDIAIKGNYFYKK